MEDVLPVSISFWPDTSFTNQPDSIMKFGGQAAESTRILYGGSVKSSNSKELLALANVDRALVGGASLKAPDFIEIIKSVKP